MHHVMITLQGTLAPLVLFVCVLTTQTKLLHTEQQGKSERQVHVKCSSAHKIQLLLADRVKLYMCYSTN
jgi:hypothetical protein